MRSLHFADNTEQEKIEIFEEYFHRDLEKGFSSSIACCDNCVDDFIKSWPGTYLRDAQQTYIDIEQFLGGSFLKDDFYPEEMLRLSKHLKCPNCSAILEGGFLIYEHPFDIPPKFAADLEAISLLATRSPFLLLTHPFARRTFDVVSSLGQAIPTKKINRTFYRARRDEGLPLVDVNDFGRPPARFVHEGRYNHAGHSMLYLAMDQRTALAEITKPGESYHVAALSVEAEWRVLELEIRDDANTDEEILIQCLARSALCGAPRTGEGWEAKEYVFTRFVADCARYAGFDCIQYGSIKDPAGTNLVLLEPPAKLSELATLLGVRRLP